MDVISLGGASGIGENVVTQGLGPGPQAPPPPPPPKPPRVTRFRRAGGGGGGGSSGPSALDCVPASAEALREEIRLARLRRREQREREEVERQERAAIFAIEFAEAVKALVSSGRLNEVPQESYPRTSYRSWPEAVAVEPPAARPDTSPVAAALTYPVAYPATSTPLTILPPTLARGFAQVVATGASVGTPEASPSVQVGLSASPPATPAAPSKVSVGAAVAMLAAGVAGVALLARSGGATKGSRAKPVVKASSSRTSSVQEVTKKRPRWSRKSYPRASFETAEVETKSTKRPRARPVADQVVVEYPAHASIQEKWVKCGKPACLSCPHGPYLYAMWAEDGHTITKYLGKK